MKLEASRIDMVTVLQILGSHQEGISPPIPRTCIPFLLLLLSLAPATKAEEEVHLQCTPRQFQVVPGESIRVKLTVQAEDAAPIGLHVPNDPLLTLRALEKLPMRQSKDGVIVHGRVIIWQALEPGSVKIESLSVETKGRKLVFPEISITVRDPGP